MIELKCRFETKDPDAVLSTLVDSCGFGATLEAKIEAKPEREEYWAKIYAKTDSEALLFKKKLIQIQTPIFTHFRMRSISSNQWALRWKKGLKNVRILNKLVIQPLWLKYKKRRGEKVIRLDPDMAFGTGHHATTQMCLEWLVQQAHDWKSICDVGCGSGILSIAAAKLGIQEILALDMDPEAILISQKNARLNRVAQKIKFIASPLQKIKSKKGYSAVLANLTALDIKKNWKELEQLTNQNLILAGIEESQVKEFLPWLQSHKNWKILEGKSIGEWHGWLLKKQFKV
ncbi:MAG: 50S ribosomal protein L11 methyltransferase [Chlamydiae bacterium]|nr:50S ribosomal protein L11 methyltransferase [Chlamydiota bacterium]